MPDNDPTFSSVPESKAVPKKRTRLSLVWVIPIVAAVAGVWIAVTKILNQGPEITIVFQTADGLEANKTKISYNGLNVGIISALRLSDDHKQVIATAQMHPKTKEFLVKDTKFWVVRPRVSGFNVTGLGTLISGNYIGVQLGQSKESERDFVALEAPPLADNIPGHLFNLKTTELGSLGAGAPIYFRQLQAGQVVSCELDKSGEFLNVEIFIKAPYDQYVSPDTRFWQASGIDVTLSAAGLHVETESLLSILSGGIAFETSMADPNLPPAAAGTTFTLFDNHDAAFRPLPSDPHNYVLVFDQAVRGLTVGAPVVMNGITVGEVTQINPQLDVGAVKFSVPVVISVDPLRYGVKYLALPPGQDARTRQKTVMDTLVAHGLRARLKTGNLLTGSLYVAVDLFPDAAPATLDWSQNPVQLPTLPDKIEAIEDSIASLIKNLNQTVVVTRGTLTNADTLLQNLDTTLTTTRGTLTNANTLLNNAGNLVAPDSMFNAELINLLQQGGGAAQSLRVLADYLERHPEALIRGKTGAAKP
jgi:paraquat-inducible protein B